MLQWFVYEMKSTESLYTHLHSTATTKAVLATSLANITDPKEKATMEKTNETVLSSLRETFISDFTKVGHSNHPPNGLLTLPLGYG
jgi:hypothetical protein